MQVGFVGCVAAGIEHSLEIQAGGGGDRALERAVHRAILVARLDGDRRSVAQAEGRDVDGVAVGMFGDLA
ncbi:hypothetical protein D9M72_591870 [compost metagenome]